MDFTIHGDTNYLTDSDRKKELDAMLIFSNLSGTVYFPTRIRNQSRSAIDNIFTDVSKFENYTIYPLFIGLSDHVAQLIIHDIHLQKQNCQIQTTRKNQQTYYVLMS
jgi:hypothetical protein